MGCLFVCSSANAALLLSSFDCLDSQSVRDRRCFFHNVYIVNKVVNGDVLPALCCPIIHHHSLRFPNRSSTAIHGLPRHSYQRCTYSFKQGPPGGTFCHMLPCPSFQEGLVQAPALFQHPVQVFCEAGGTHPQGEKGERIQPEFFPS